MNEMRKEDTETGWREMTSGSAGLEKEKCGDDHMRLMEGGAKRLMCQATWLLVQMGCNLAKRLGRLFSWFVSNLGQQLFLPSLH